LFFDSDRRGAVSLGLKEFWFGWSRAYSPTISVLNERTLALQYFKLEVGRCQRLNPPDDRNSKAALKRCSILFKAPSQRNWEPK
jgi:hypothetical protein